MTITCCLDCEKHLTINDRDPHDWFNDDDMAVVCTLVANPRRDTKSEYISNRNEYRSVATACRPYKLRCESITPDWCPLKVKEEQMKYPQTCVTRKEPVTTVGDLFAKLKTFTEEVYGDYMSDVKIISKNKRWETENVNFRGESVYDLPACLSICIRNATGVPTRDWLGLLLGDPEGSNDLSEMSLAARVIVFEMGKGATPFIKQAWGIKDVVFVDGIIEVHIRKLGGRS